LSRSAGFTGGRYVLAGVSSSLKMSTRVARAEILGTGLNAVSSSWGVSSQFLSIADHRGGSTRSRMIEPVPLQCGQSKVFGDITTSRCCSAVSPAVTPRVRRSPSPPATLRSVYRLPRGVLPSRADVSSSHARKSCSIARHRYCVYEHHQADARMCTRLRRALVLHVQ